jgi:hypothetical protein
MLVRLTGSHGHRSPTVRQPVDSLEIRGSSPGEKVSTRCWVVVLPSR